MCKDIAPGPYTPAFVYHQRHLDVDCKTTFVELAKEMYPNETFNFDQNMKQVGGGQRLVVGRNITLSCLCPMKTVTPGNKDYIMCLPDFTYFYHSFLGCWDRECNTSLLPPVPALGSWNWPGGRALTSTKITYTCGEWTLFEGLWIPTLTTRCTCSETWSLTSVPECINVSTTPVPPTTTTTTTLTTFSTTYSTTESTATTTATTTTNNITTTTSSASTTTDDVTKSTTNTTSTTNDVTATTTDTTDITQATEKEAKATSNEGKLK
ncbi:cell wall integrity and stress response component 1-like [Penaeus monodon]|uniref:cell wall integrity and stress response component 1-like n=1 Tax=Penaeus monodon TaxID=6687 RepID=UPI0018A756B0|nr:cell wall integrity and stress response component 1-like [Penaeus monodon]